MHTPRSLHPVGLLGLLLAALLLCTTLAACGNAEMEELRSQLAACRAQNSELQEQLRELRQATADEPDAEDMERRIRQLETTLNRAYIDMKAALVERDACLTRLQERDGG